MSGEEEGWYRSRRSEDSRYLGLVHEALVELLHRIKVKQLVD